MPLFIVRIISLFVVLLAAANVVCQEPSPQAKKALQDNIKTIDQAAGEKIRHKELEQMAWMLGTWRCKATILFSLDGSKRISFATQTTRLALNRTWFSNYYQETKDNTNKPPLISQDYFTYDPNTLTWIGNGIDTAGNSWTLSSPGWEENKMVWTGNALIRGKEIPFRYTWFKKSVREFELVGELKPADEWITVDRIVLKKQSKGK